MFFGVYHSLVVAFSANHLCFAPRCKDTVAAGCITARSTLLEHVRHECA